MFEIPPRKKNSKGEIRKVGFELEYSDLKLETATEIIKKIFGGEEKKINNFFYKIENTSKGNFEIKIDASFLSETKYEKVFEGNPELEKLIGTPEFHDKLGNILKKLFSTVVPYEIIAPPINIDEIAVLEDLRKELQAKKASGTKHSAYYAFGVHINPEMPELNLDVILNYFRAFIILFPWLKKELKIDLARRITPFINPFPPPYNQKVLDKGYKPDLDTFIEDYHEYNPDRNRPLDLYPLFAWLRKEKINGMKNLGKVSARPTLHYRLPNSKMDDEKWSLAEEWNYWVVVEKLANNPALINQMAEEYLKFNQKSIIGFEQKWRKQTNEWLHKIS